MDMKKIILGFILIASIHKTYSSDKNLLIKSGCLDVAQTIQAAGSSIDELITVGVKDGIPEDGAAGSFWKII